MTDFTGVQVVEGVEVELMQQLFNERSLSVKDIQPRKPAFPNSFLVMKSSTAGSSAVVRVSPKGDVVYLIRETALNACGVKPRNKEQAMVLSTLLDDRIPVQIIAGRAGTGKTLLTLAAAMQKVEEGVYNKIVLTKPMSQVGEYELGILPGTVEEKFAPFLINYASNVEQLLGEPCEAEKSKKAPKKSKEKHFSADEPRTGLQGLMAQFFTKYNVEMVPLQLLRGASLHSAFIIADEIQVLGHHEMLTLGTRVAENSKLVLMGDLNQRDEKIARNATGLYKTIHDTRMQESALVSYIELQKVERGPVAELFTRVFETPAS
jgi:PhoH-like ATPase